MKYLVLFLSCLITTSLFSMDVMDENDYQAMHAYKKQSVITWCFRASSAVVSTAAALISQGFVNWMFTEDGISKETLGLGFGVGFATGMVVWAGCRACYVGLDNYQERRQKQIIMQVQAEDPDSCQPSESSYGKYWMKKSKLITPKLTPTDSDPSTPRFEDLVKEDTFN